MNIKTFLFFVLLFAIIMLMCWMAGKGNRKVQQRKLLGAANRGLAKYEHEAGVLIIDV